MKKFLPSVLGVGFLLVLLSGIFGSGCATTGGSTPGTVDTNKLYKGAVLLKTTVSSSVIVAIEKDTNAVRYIQIVGGALDAIIGGSDYTPQKLEKVLADLKIKELQKPEARIAINTVLGLYEVYYADYVRGRIEGNQTAMVLLTALRDGIRQGLPP